jgi:hypothetical protein
MTWVKKNREINHWSGLLAFLAALMHRFFVIACTDEY